MTTGAEFAHYTTGTMTRRCLTLDMEMPELITDLHPGDAEELQVQDGDIVRVSSRRGSILSRVRFSDRVKRGIIFMPFHFEEAAANLLTNPAMDPISKTPEYKVCAVRIEKADLADQQSYS